MLMRIRWMTAGLAATGLLVGPFAFPAQAGQASGHNVETVECEGLGTVDVSVQPSHSDNTWGAVQLVGTTGHLIPVVFEFTLEDLTKGTVLFSDTAAKGSGHANGNQALVTCSETFTGTFDELAEPGEELPPGVDPDDILQISLTVQVVAKA
jgi:hypothetical protein